MVVSTTGSRPRTASRHSRVEVLLLTRRFLDVVVLRQTLHEADVAHHLSVVGDAATARAFLRRTERFADAPWPDVVVLARDQARECGLAVADELTRHVGASQPRVVVLDTADVPGGAGCTTASPAVRLRDVVEVVRAAGGSAPAQRRASRCPIAPTAASRPRRGRRITVRAVTSPGH